MAGTLFTVALFKTSDNLAAAYGIAVSGTMLATTLLLYRVAVTLWAWPQAAAIPVIAAFAAIDATFLVSNSMKIVAGGWFPVVVGATIAVLMLTWRRGASLLRQRLREMSIPLNDFLDYADKTVIGRAPGVGVWLTKVDDGVSPMLQRHVEHNRVLHETVVLLSFVRRTSAACAIRQAPHGRETRPRLLSNPEPAWIHADAGHSADDVQLQDAWF